MKNHKAKNKISISFLILLVFFAVGFLLLKQAPQAVRVIDADHMKIGGVVLNIERAVTPQAHAQGLSGRKEMKDNEGMLFIFDKVGKYGFWMKDMNFPIDMIWIGDDFRVVSIQKNAQPASYPQIFGDSVDSRYVLEVISGFSEKNNLQIGDTVEFFR